MYFDKNQATSNPSAEGYLATRPRVDALRSMVRDDS